MTPRMVSVQGVNTPPNVPKIPSDSEVWLRRGLDSPREFRFVRSPVLISSFRSRLSGGLPNESIKADRF